MSKTPSFSLDGRLKSDTIFVAGLAYCDCLLMDDQRWPWLILVPRIGGLEELADIEEGARSSVMAEALAAGQILKEISGCEKLNTAAIGNVVRQLHIHVIARSTGDPNWPGPVWGYGKPVPYGPDEGEELSRKLETLLIDPLVS